MCRFGGAVDSTEFSQSLLLIEAPGETKSQNLNCKLIILTPGCYSHTQTAVTQDKGRAQIQTTQEQNVSVRRHRSLRQTQVMLSDSFDSECNILFLFRIKWTEVIRTLSIMWSSTQLSAVVILATILKIQYKKPCDLNAAKDRSISIPIIIRCE